MYLIFLIFKSINCILLSILPYLIFLLLLKVLFLAYMKKDNRKLKHCKTNSNRHKFGKFNISNLLPKDNFKSLLSFGK